VFIFYCDFRRFSVPAVPVIIAFASHMLGKQNQSINQSIYSIFSLLPDNFQTCVMRFESHTRIQTFRLPPTVRKRQWS